ncbi:MAG: hypothetical protein ACKO0X_03125 [Bacteroidota bacterium]
MKKTRTGFILTIIFIAVCHSVSGQSSSKEHTSNTTGPSFKAKDVSRTEKTVQDSSVIDPASLSNGEKKKDATSSPVNHSQTQQAFDFDKLSPFVQDKVSENKIQGNDPLESIATVYLVEMPDCDSPASTQRITETLSYIRGIFKTEFVAPFRIKIYCDLNLSSVDLKAIMNEKGFKFNFISKDYYVVD